MNAYLAGGDRSRYALTAYPAGQFMRIRKVMAHRLRSGGGRRGRVLRFSAASRRRLIEAVATIRTDELARARFVTLTFPKDFALGRCCNARDAFLKRVARRWPLSGTIWVREWQGRGLLH